jgi:hypothetical protein
MVDRLYTERLGQINAGIRFRTWVRRPVVVPDMRWLQWDRKFLSSVVKRLPLLKRTITVSSTSWTRVRSYPVPYYIF